MFGQTSTPWTAIRAALIGAVAAGGLLVSAGTQAAPRFTQADLAATLPDEDDDGGFESRGRFGGGPGEDRYDDGATREPRGDLIESRWGGPPYGNAWGHRRKHWRHHHYGWGGPRHWQRCRTVWQRRYDPWRGWTSYPVRRCW